MNEHSTGLLLTVGCVVDAPRERVFAVMTDPTYLAQWWGPEGFTTPDVKLDLRVGGSYRLTMQPPDGEAFHLSGQYLEIDPPSTLLYTFNWEEPTADDRETVVRVILDPDGAGTRISVAQASFATEERLSLHKSGWRESLEKLRALVETR